MKVYSTIFESIASPESLFGAWDAFRIGKRAKPDVGRFERHLEENIFDLHRSLIAKTYRHGPYQSFYIRDPKQRHIHKASVRDRVLHHAVFAALNPVFEPTFIPASFSCRTGYGTHLGVRVLERMARRVNQNGTSPCFVLKCDIQKFFDSVDHAVLLEVLGRRIKDEMVMWLLREIVGSFVSPRATLFERKGLPIGNLTSQLFANVYMNEFDQFAKHELRVKHYARYTDDFAIASSDRAFLTSLLPRIEGFLERRLALRLHPKKISLRTLHQGVDFLGYIVFPRHRLVRAKTRRRMFAKLRAKVRDYRAEKISEDTLDASLQSYLGVLSHANAHKAAEELRNELWFAG
jgi:RNA-directed DNA polymerase